MATLKTLLGGFAALSLLASGSAVMNHSGLNTAHAQSTSAKATVDAAIKRGEIGEQLDGYLGVVDGATPSAAAKSAMSEINIARKAVYSRLATAQKVQVSQVSGLTGEKQIAKAAPGTYVKGNRGWRKK